MINLIDFLKDQLMVSLTSVHLFIPSISDTLILRLLYPTHSGLKVFWSPKVETEVIGLSLSSEIAVSLSRRLCLRSLCGGVSGLAVATDNVLVLRGCAVGSALDPCNGGGD